MIYLFTKEHKNLQKEGEKWMKETATASMFVATMIATIVFALACGNEESAVVGISCFPRFREKSWFNIFIL